LYVHVWMYSDVNILLRVCERSFLNWFITFVAILSMRNKWLHAPIITNSLKSKIHLRKYLKFSSRLIQNNLRHFFKDQLVNAL
jgi:hypothetical protein